MKKTAAAKQLTANRKLLPELAALFFVFFTLLLAASLFTHSQADPGMNHVGNSATVHNAAGLFGAYLSSALADLFGLASYIWPVFFLLVALRLSVWRAPLQWWRWLGLFLFGLIFSWGCEAFGFRLGDIPGGGLLGFSIHSFFSGIFSPFGAVLLWLLATICSIQLLFNLSFSDLAQAARSAFFAIRTFVLQSLGKENTPASGTAENKAESKAERKEIAIRFPRMREEEPADAAGQDTHEVSAGPGQADAPEIPATSGISATSSAADAQAGSGVNTDAPAKAVLEEKPTSNASPDAPGDTTAPQRFKLPRLSTLAVGKFFSKKKAEPDTRKKRPEPLAVEPPEQLLHVADALAQEQLEPLPNWLSAAFGDSSTRSVAVATPQKLPIELPDAAAEPANGSSARPSSDRQGKRRRVPLPGLDLLAHSSGGDRQVQRELLEEKGRKVMACLADFGVQGELMGITPGPVVTMFEVRPAPGVKVSRIAGLSDDLALALKAIAVRIQAPIPGTDTVGIEIPNEHRENVNFRELLASSAFKSSESLLSMAIGKDIAGTPTVSDLAKMPHLLVAGATGAGKSVCLNSILLSLLYKARPDEVRLLLVDPKRIELAVYEGLPHLVHPVVTEMHQAKNALDWAVQEMEERYKSIARLGVRNITAYNEKLAALGANPPAELADLQPMPFLIIIIDELADLMLTASKEVETSIVRLAQLARAAGMHMIIATQRPSVDVVTGLIKANFPCRISFQVTSKHDSRTILDTVGAEHLLGKGDMLYKPSGGKLRRLHGAFVSDDEVVNVVDYWKRQLPPAYLVDLTDWSKESQGDMVSSGADSNDSMYAEAVAFVRSQGRASISQVQRRFRIGFNKAARYVEQMEEDGIIGPADGSRPREVLK